MIEGALMTDNNCLKLSSTQGIHMEHLLMFKSQFKIPLNWDLNTECMCVCIKVFKYELYNEKPYTPTLLPIPAPRPRPRPISLQKMALLVYFFTVLFNIIINLTFLT